MQECFARYPTVYNKSDVGVDDDEDPLSMDAAKGLINESNIDTVDQMEEADKTTNLTNTTDNTEHSKDNKLNESKES